MDKGQIVESKSSQRSGFFDRVIKRQSQRTYAGTHLRGRELPALATRNHVYERAI
jgi:hypothetical protein